MFIPGWRPRSRKPEWCLDPNHRSSTDTFLLSRSPVDTHIWPVTVHLYSCTPVQDMSNRLGAKMSKVSVCLLVTYVLGDTGSFSVQRHTGSNRSGHFDLSGRLEGNRSDVTHLNRWPESPLKIYLDNISLVLLSVPVVTTWKPVFTFSLCAVGSYKITSWPVTNILISGSSRDANLDLQRGSKGHFKRSLDVFGENSLEGLFKQRRVEGVGHHHVASAETQTSQVTSQVTGNVTGNMTGEVTGNRHQVWTCAYPV